MSGQVAGTIHSELQQICEDPQAMEQGPQAELESVVLVVAQTPLPLLVQQVWLALHAIAQGPHLACVLVALVVTQVLLQQVFPDGQPVPHPPPVPPPPDES